MMIVHELAETIGDETVSMTTDNWLPLNAVIVPSKKLAADAE
jgi:hypothetical protein